MTRRQFFATAFPAFALRRDLPPREVTIRRQPNGTYAVCWEQDGAWQASIYGRVEQATSHAMRYLIQDQI